MARATGVIRTFVCPDCTRTRQAFVWLTEVNRDGPRVWCACGQGMHDQALGRRVDGVVPDDIPGGMVMEHVEPGRVVYSRTELNQVLAPHGYRVSDYGWTGETETVYTKGEGYADFRTQEERIAQMAAFLGLTPVEYRVKFAEWL